MISVGVGDDDILYVVQEIGSALRLTEMENVGARVDQQVVMDENRRKSAVEGAGDVGVDIPIRRAGAEKGDFHGEISLQK